jgi:hypothetical protein
MTTRDQSLARRRAWSDATREMLDRSIASGMRGEVKHRLPPQEHPLTAKQFSDYAFAKLIEDSRARSEKRRGKRAPVSQVQSQYLRRGKAVTLPPLSFLEGTKE